MSNSTKSSIRPDLERMGQLIRDAADVDAEAANVLQEAERRKGGNRRAEDAPPKFTCPKCGGQVSRVESSRPGVIAERVIRWRECLVCYWLYGTEERVKPDALRPPMRKRAV